jgi:hypothetical protein
MPHWPCLGPTTSTCSSGRGACTKTACSTAELVEPQPQCCAARRKQRKLSVNLLLTHFMAALNLLSWPLSTMQDMRPASRVAPTILRFKGLPRLFAGGVCLVRVSVDAPAAASTSASSCCCWSPGGRLHWYQSSTSAAGSTAACVQVGWKTTASLQGGPLDASLWSCAGHSCSAHSLC